MALIDIKGRLSGLVTVHNSVQIVHISAMDEISQQLVYQRVRNRVIEVLELYCSLDDLAKFGAFEAINMADDWLVLDYKKAPKVFNQKERDAVGDFMKLWDVASNATNEDISSVAEFESSMEWVRLCETAKQAVLIFSERGRFSEEIEEVMLN